MTKLKSIARRAQSSRSVLEQKLKLARAKRGVMLGPGSVVNWLGFQLKINDVPNYYSLVKDIALGGIYEFATGRPDPRILDCGSNIGASILYFKSLYPSARVIGFEADPLVLPYLEGNLRANNLRDVEIVRAALSSSAGQVGFLPDGLYGGRISSAEESLDASAQEIRVPTARLYDYLDEPVDFLKMNIEGAEFEVLLDASDRLPNIEQMVIEYHHLPGLPRTLHQILDLLHDRGFEYLVNDFDEQTNPACKPPFHLDPQSRYFLAVYAKRIT